MHRKIIIAVAPTGSWGCGNYNPITPEAIARDVMACAEAGATFLRVGFEDSLVYNGNTATSNAELVTALRAELEVAGFSIASAPEARALLLG